MLYKKLKSFVLLLTIGVLNAQVGINTTTPTRTLDVNGDLRLRSTVDKATDPAYNRVLVKDVDGKVDYWTKQEVLNKIEALYVVNKKFTASKTGPDPATIVACGKFEFRYNSPVMPQIRLATAGTGSTRIYYNRIRKRDSSANGFTTETGRSFNSNQYVTIPRANTWQNIGASSDSTGNFTNNTFDEYYITYPGDTNMYRVTFLARNAGGGNVNYSMVCEKF
ncbi:hypothetical protein SAMN05660477_02712 [Soonwooa buanensis]|uniref:HmuY protein n=1 Tax=Soonwooa buanensis TaxID=619805 RepID=A0A1T5GCQ4_9FLAO|nr:hypothetical protein [Soonwooa buanensis]SKC06067.1 hypothetical protein SAMN05660477_02712 [Soonwooa buanensis]